LEISIKVLFVQTLYQLVRCFLTTRVTNRLKAFHYAYLLGYFLCLLHGNKLYAVKKQSSFETGQTNSISSNATIYSTY